MNLAVGVTGSTGFVGRKIVDNLVKEGAKVIALQRSESLSQTIPSRKFDLSNLSTINTELLDGIDVVIHTAALVHDSSATQSEHELLNVDATSKLLSVSKECGVKKFIFVSTVGVYGVSSDKSHISIETAVNPQTPYAKAKYKSELELLANASRELKISIFRLPLVIGENAPGNFGFLEKIAKTKLPLPFGLAKNKRSVISVGTVANVMKEATQCLAAFEGLHLLAESPPVSTKELIVGLRKKYGKSANLLPVPKIMMKLLLCAIGKRKIYEQLYEDLVFITSVDVSNFIKPVK